MYENEYEEYMRAVLGYPQTNDTYYNKSYFPYNNDRKIDENQINKFYPEIYKLLKPMVIKVCSNYRSYNIDESLLESMTMEVYNNIESDSTFVNLNITTFPESRAEGNKVLKNSPISNSQASNEDVRETRSCTKCNPLLKDLIKILILNEISNKKPPRPHHPPRPPMFPYPPMPPMPYPPGSPREF